MSLSYLSQLYYSYGLITEDFENYNVKVILTEKMPLKPNPCGPNEPEY